MIVIIGSGMSAIPKALGDGLDIRQRVQVTRLQQDGVGWVLHLDTGTMTAAKVVVTVPAPQVAGLLKEGHPLLADLAPVRLVPCLTLMAAVAAPAPFITRQDSDDPLSWIAPRQCQTGPPARAGYAVGRAGG